MTVETLGLTAERCVELLDAREVSCRELVEAYLDRIEAHDGDFNAFVRTRRDLALAEADAFDRDGRSGLQGVPIALKDILCTRGEETTAGSRILAGHKPMYDAGAVTRVKNAGMIPLGKTNMDEFAMGSSTEHSAYGVTHNPWDPTRVPGGSSGGSAAAVAAGFAPLALGTDTGGSIRQPAALCGVVGLKPTYGAVSRHGLIAFGSSLDQVGPFALTVRDAALAFATIAGKDHCDSTSVELAEPVAHPRPRGSRRRPHRRARRSCSTRASSPACGRRSTRRWRSPRASAPPISEVELPHAHHALPAYYLIAPAEASANLARFDGVRYGLRLEEPGDTVVDMYGRTRVERVRRRGQAPHHARHLRALGRLLRRLLRHRAQGADADPPGLRRGLRDVDVIAMPTSPTVAFTIGERVDDPWAMYACDVLTVPLNLAGLPGISIPCGLSEELPVGLQLAGPPFSENRLLDAAHAMERALQFDPVPPRLGQGVA